MRPWNVSAAAASLGCMNTQPLIRPGDTLENPVTGERFTFTHTAASTDGELLAFDFALRAGGSVPIPHVHPVQTERFEVVEGRMRFLVGLRRRPAGPGDVVEIPPGVAHSFANPGPDEARLRIEVRPALTMERMIAEVVAMAHAGRLTARGLPRSPRELARLARTYDEVAHAPFLSLGIQRLLLAPLARFELDGGSLEAVAGDVVVVAPGAPHRFESLGPDRLRLVAIPAAPQMQTEWLDRSEWHNSEPRRTR
jgi:mannose-6-phosphate isomerase-like protein (cupin superfamily)